MILLAGLAVAPAALAQVPEPDASLPDASVGQGGADRGSEENDPNDRPCLTARDCEDRFTCRNGRCVPTTIRNASCGGTAALLVPVLGVGLLALARRRENLSLRSGERSARRAG